MWCSTCFKFYKPKSHMIMALLPVMFIDLRDIINYYPRFWFAVVQYNLLYLFCNEYKLHWWAADQNLLFVFNISPVIWQKYKIMESCSNILWSGVYIQSGKSLGNFWSGKCPVGEMYIRKVWHGEVSVKELSYNR